MNMIQPVDLTIWAEDLPRLHTFNETDPFAVLYTLDPITNEATQVGMTELIRNNRSPHFATLLRVSYLFQAIQNLRIDIYHAEEKTTYKSLDKQELIGSVTFRLADMMVNRGQKLENLPLKNGKKKDLGTVRVSGEPVADTNNLFVVTFRATKLANKGGFFGTSDPFIEVKRITEDNQWVGVWKSPHLNNSLNPNWTTVKIPLSALCNNDPYRPLKVCVYDHESKGNHIPMGEVEWSLNELISMFNDDLYNPNTPKVFTKPILEKEKAAKDKKYVNSGELHFGNVHIERHATLSEYLRGGLQISFECGVDYTSSNGDPASPKSLHHLSPTGALNPYEQALSAVGKVLEPYDHDNEIAIYGFGAKDKTDAAKPAMHDFAISADGPLVKGIDGLLSAYRNSVTQYMLSGPTLFAPLIRRVTQSVISKGCTQIAPRYTVLMIITDGVVNDMEDTKRAIIEASREAMSIIIIGVGEEDFSAMSALDSDEQLLTSGNVTATRDIVQFVDLKFHATRGPAFVAEQVLKELPDQIIKFMEWKKIVPIDERA